MSTVQQASGLFSGTSFTVTLPGASSASNKVVVIVAGNTIVTAPGTFALRDSQVNQMGHYLFDATGGASSWAFTCGAGQGTWVALEIASGVFAASLSANDVASAISYITPALTPAAGLKTVIASVASLQSTALVRTITFDSGFTEQADLCQPTVDYPMQGVATLEATVSGSTAYSTTGTFDNASTGKSAIIAAYATTAAGGGSAFIATPADPEGITDAITSVKAYVRVVADALGLTDVATPVGAGVTTDYVRLIADATGVTDTGLPQQTVFDLPYDDPLGLTDTATPALVVGGAVPPPVVPPTPTVVLSREVDRMADQHPRYYYAFDPAFYARGSG